MAENQIFDPALYQPKEAGGDTSKPAGRGEQAGEQQESNDSGLPNGGDDEDTVKPAGRSD